MDWYAAKFPGISYYAVGFAENVTRLPAEIWTPTPTAATVEVVTPPATTATAAPSVPTAPQPFSPFAFAGVLAAAGALLLYLRW